MQCQWAEKSDASVGTPNTYIVLTMIREEKKGAYNFFPRMPLMKSSQFCVGVKD